MLIKIDDAKWVRPESVSAVMPHDKGCTVQVGGTVYGISDKTADEIAETINQDVSKGQ